MPSKFEIQRKKIIFHLILVGIVSILTLSVETRWVEGFVLIGQNPQSVTKVICRQSLLVGATTLYI